jgi:sec-independent protein translocase protein TatA
MGLPQGPEWIYILVIALLLFGAKRLPEIGRSLGKGMREFKQSISGLTDDEDKEKKESPKSDA